MARTLPDIVGIKAFDSQGLEDLLDELGTPKFRAKQLQQWIYDKRVTSYDEMTNLPKSLRAQLSADFPLYSATPVEILKSKDGSRKYLIELCDGEKVEAVGIPSNGRLTVCFSTQVGCGMGCAFCATGKGGFVRNLAPGEMYDQIAIVEDDFGTRVTNAVSMGQGEPFLNYDATLGAIRFMNSQNGLNIGARHITISTCGILQGIRKLASEPEQFTLAVSLHSAVQRTRDILMPNVSKFTLDRLRSSLVSYSQSTGRRPTFEYALINGVNDTDAELEALVEFCSGLLCHVNLINLNKVEGSKYSPSDPDTAKRFISALKKTGTEASLRSSKGSDVYGACGQLAQKSK